MNEDQESNNWKLFIQWTAIVLCVLIMSIASCSMQQNYIIQVGIKHGVDPVRTSCAFSQDNGARMLCANQRGD